MKGNVLVLIADGRPDSSGDIFIPEGIELPKGEVPIILEGRRGDLAAYVGKAVLRMDGPFLKAEVTILSNRITHDAHRVLYPAVGGSISMGTAKPGKSAVRITDIILSICRNQDPRIGTLGEQGLKP